MDIYTIIFYGSPVALLFVASYAAFITILHRDAQRERDEAVDSYNRAWMLGHSAGLQEAAAEYKARVPWQDGFEQGYAVAKTEQERVLEVGL